MKELILINRDEVSRPVFIT